eukprot:1136128-Pelagomonas_calceolata.AAC.2
MDTTGERRHKPSNTVIVIQMRIKLALRPIFSGIGHKGCNFTSKFSCEDLLDHASLLMTQIWSSINESKGHLPWLVHPFSGKSGHLMPAQNFLQSHTVTGPGSALDSFSALQGGA